MGMLDGRVAVVTGAGEGLGRAEALELARHGAAVVVHALDTAAAGAEAVADEIRTAGGRAAVHVGDVSDWAVAAALVNTAVHTLGGLDIVVNNQSLHRDHPTFELSEQDWDAVIGVHLKGHFCVTRHATAYWRDRAKAAGGPVFARLINTAAESGLRGSPAQPNFAAATAGVIGLTLSVARASVGHGVAANVVCPRSRTRRTEGAPWRDRRAREGPDHESPDPESNDPGAGLQPDDEHDAFSPLNVAPLVAVLASPAAQRVNGRVFVSFGGSVQLLAEPDDVHRFDNPGGGPWDADALAVQLEAFFSDARP